MRPRSMRRVAAARLALGLVCGSLLVMASAPPAAAADFDFTAPRSATDPSAAATMRDLAERLLPVYQETDRDLYLANLSALQMVAGSYVAADVSRQSLSERLPRSDAQRPLGRAVIFDIYDEAKAREARDHVAFAESFAKSFRRLIPRLSDLQAYRVSTWLATSPAGFRQALQNEFDRLRNRNAISESDATQLVWSYLSFEAYREFAPLVATLEAEDQGRRYADSEVTITTPHGGSVSARVIRPLTPDKPLPALLEFMIDSGSPPVSPAGYRSLSFAQESAAHGYVGVVARARPAGDRSAVRSAVRMPFETQGDDARAVIGWMAAQSWSDGRVGMYGEGIGGYAAWAAAKRTPTALKAIATSGASAPGVDFPMEGNIALNSAFEWSSSKASRRRELDQKWYRSGRRYRDLGRIAGSYNRAFIRWLNHPSYDRYWQKLVPYRREFAALDIPVLTLSGFYAASEPAAVYYFRQHTRYNPHANHTLLIGPYDDAALQDNPTSVLQRLRLDPAAVVDLHELRYQWFDHIFKDTASPALLQDRVNYQVAGSDEWRYAPGIADMENAKLRFYLSSKASHDGHHALQDSSADKNSTDQSVNFTDRRDADWIAATNLQSQSPEIRNGVLFESAPLKRATDLTGAFSGHLEFTINKMDVDLAMTLYERLASGVYIRLLSPAYQFRASYARDRAHRHLLKAGERQGLDFQSERLVGRRLQTGSELVLVLSVQKRPDQEINYGTGEDVSEESLADGKIPVKIRWHAGSYLDLPIRR